MLDLEFLFAPAPVSRAWRVCRALYGEAYLRDRPTRYRVLAGLAEAIGGEDGRVIARWLSGEHRYG